MNISKIANNYVHSVRREIEFDCKPEEVWDIISRKSNLELFHPFCQKILQLFGRKTITKMKSTTPKVLS